MATQRVRFRATVKESGDGTPYLVFELVDRDLPRLAGGTLALHLSAGASIGDAREVARTLNAHVDSFSIG